MVCWIMTFVVDFKKWTILLYDDLLLLSRALSIIRKSPFSLSQSLRNNSVLVSYYEILMMLSRFEASVRHAPKYFQRFQSIHDTTRLIFSYKANDLILIEVRVYLVLIKLEGHADRYLRPVLLFLLFFFCFRTYSPYSPFQDILYAICIEMCL